jgi:hypothetical protein
MSSSASKTPAGMEMDNDHGKPARLGRVTSISDDGSVSKSAGGNAIASPAPRDFIAGSIS